MMECPHCHQEIEGKLCPACGANIPAQSRYCMDCGSALAEKQKETVEQDAVEEEDSFELEARILCSDGNCTGIIVDGKCSECGNLCEESKADA